MKFNKTGLYTTFLLVFVFLLSGSVLLNSCKKKGSSSFQFTGDTIADGEKLVQIYCTKCHQEVPTNALTGDVWKYHTLPVMSHYFGLSTYGPDYFKNNPDSTSGISLPEWQAIVAYYKKAAPATLEPSKAPSPLVEDWAGFTLKKPLAGNDVAFTTMVAVNPYNHKIYSSDVKTEELYEWDSDLKPKVIAKLPTAAVSASFIQDAGGASQGLFTSIGQLQPVDFPNGKVLRVDLGAKGATATPTVIASELARPVQTITGDFNKDGLADWVICGEGFKSGGVYLLTQKADHSFNQTTIANRAGAVQAVAGDFNNDGWQDVMILFGSGDEGLWLFLNDHKGGFTSRNLLRFPPVNGSTSFQLADLNHDGKLDLIYTCGYNYYDSRILKPYHGLYVFTNEGDWKFKQSYFYPINGCTKAIAADFDGDGDLDIATIAFFADFKGKPAESFVYFEQNKQLSFKPHAIPVSKYGRWMSMDVADVNNDGKPDIVLGNYSKGFILQQDLVPFWDEHLPFIILENHNKK
ncbi:MAG: FG-GAP repeat domain-containing protein [Mucilaginibacter sp.]